MDTPLATLTPTASAGARSRRGLRVGWLLRAALALGLLALTVHLGNWPQIWATLRAAPWPVHVIGLSALLAGQALCAWRFQVLLAAQSIGIGYGYSLKLTLAGAFASLFLPSTVGGDALKLVALRLRGHRVPGVLATILMDRVSNLAVVAGMLVSLWWAPGLLPLTTGRWISGGAGVLVVGGVLLIGIALAGRGRSGRQAAVSVPHPDGRPDGRQYGMGHPQERTRWQRARRRLRVIVTRWWRQPEYVLAALGLSLALNLCVQVSLWLVARLLGLPIGPVTMIAATCLVLILSLVPISINALGVQEASFSYFLVQAGAPLEQAIVIALLARCFQLGSVLPGAACLVLLRRDGRR